MAIDTNSKPNETDKQKLSRITQAVLETKNSCSALNERVKQMVNALHINTQCLTYCVMQTWLKSNMRQQLSKNDLEADSKFSMFQNLLKQYRYASVKGLPKWNHEEPGLHLDFVEACNTNWDTFKYNSDKQRVIDTVSAGWEAYFRFWLFCFISKTVCVQGEKSRFQVYWRYM